MKTLSMDITPSQWCKSINNYSYVYHWILLISSFAPLKISTWHLMLYLFFSFYQLLRKHKLFHRTKFLKTTIFCTWLSVVAPKDSKKELFLADPHPGLPFWSLQRGELCSATGSVSFCLLLVTFSKESIYKRPRTYSMLPSWIQKRDLKNWIFASSDCFQITQLCYL